MIGISRNANLSRKIIRCSHRNDSQRYVISIQPIHDFVQCPVATSGGDHVHAAPRRVRGERSRLAGLEGRSGSTKWPLSRTQLDEMADVGAVGARSMDDQRDVLGWHGVVLAHITRLCSPMRSSSCFAARAASSRRHARRRRAHARAARGGRAHVTGVDRDPNALAEASRRLGDFAAAGRFSAVESNYARGRPDCRARRHGTSTASCSISASRRTRSTTPAAGLPSVPARRSTCAWAPDAHASAADLLNHGKRGDAGRDVQGLRRRTAGARLAREIVRRRATRPFETSDDFVGAIRAVLGPRSGAPEFARLFQAVRIAVNDELMGLTHALPALRDRLTPGGTLAVIAYHSGEDRIVKNVFRDWSAACVCPPKQPVCTCRGRPLGTTLTRRALTASEDEVHRNPRARSARLRAWQSASSRPTAVALRAGARWFRLGDDGRHCTESVGVRQRATFARFSDARRADSGAHPAGGSRSAMRRVVPDYSRSPNNA